MAAIEAWRHYGETIAIEADQQDQRYALLGMFYTGTWRNDPRWPSREIAADVYRNTRLIVKQTGAIVDCYEQLVWQGDLSTDGQPLPDGTRGAIPIDPQTGQEATDERLLRAFHMTFQMWNWRQLMSLIPKTAAIFGDVLVEIVDVTDPNGRLRGATAPNIIYPGYVPPDGLELDHSGNIKALAIEYEVVVEESTAFGRDVKADAYVYRKEMTPEAFYFYKDGKPFDYDGQPSVQPNPYGFVPATWFRHELIVGSNRGMGAYERTLTQAVEINGLLSAALDYQKKQFGAPIGIKGATSAVRPGRTVTMPGGLTITTATTDAEVDEARRQMAEDINLIGMDANGEFVTITLDIGKTRELVETLHDGLVAENPEAEYAKRMAEIANPTSPGVRMSLAPIDARVRAARRNHDTQMVKLLQMNTSMMGHHVNTGEFPSEVMAARRDRYEAFRPFTLDSYGRGLEDATIPDRDVFPESKMERAQYLAVVDALESDWARREAGIPDDEIRAMNAEQRRQSEAMAAAFSVTAAEEPTTGDSEDAGDGRPEPVPNQAAQGQGERTAGA